MPTYFLPKLLGGVLDSIPTEKIKVEEATAKTDLHLPLPGFLLTGSKRDINSFVKKARVPIDGIGGKPSEDPNDDRLRIYDAVDIDYGCGDHKYPIIYNHHMPFLGRIEFSYGNGAYYEKDFIQSFVDLMSDVSILTGHTFDLFTTGAQCATVSPFRPSQRKLSIIFAGGPYGSVVESYGQATIEDVFLDHPEKIFRPRPAPGIGVTIRSVEGDPVAQVVDSTIYLLLPVEIKYGAHYFGDKQLMKRVIFRVLLHLQRGLPKPKVRTIRGPQRYIQMKKGLDEESLILLKVREVIERSKMEAAKATYLEALRDHQATLRNIAAYTSRFDESSAREEWSRIRKIPGITETYLLDMGFYVETDRVIHEFEGNHYDLGTFRIRFDPEGSVLITSTDITHPGKIQPHPHVARDGSVCLGNISTLVHEALVEHRFADAVEMVLGWLREGYDQDSIYEPITAWPKVEQGGGRE